MTGRVLITGGTGFIGAHVAAAFEQDGWDVTVASRRSDGRHRFVAFDLADPDATRLPDVDVVVHLAAAGVTGATGLSDAAVLALNVSGTSALLRQAVRAGVRRFVYCGSCFEYPAGTRHTEGTEPDPRSAYGLSKTRAWEMVHRAAEENLVEAVTLRPFMVYGPGERPHRLVASAVRSGLAGEAIRISEGTQARDWVHVSDVARAFLLSATVESARGHTFNVCTGVETTVRDVAEMIGELLGVPLEVGAVPGRRQEFDRLSGDPAKANAVLGWRPSHDLRRGIISTIEAAREGTKSFRVDA